MGKPNRHPSPARLIESADAADALATALPKYWRLSDAPPGRNPARLRFPQSPDLEDPEFWERANSLWVQVAKPWAALARCLAGASVGNWLDGLGLREDVREKLGLPHRLHSERAVAGWCYDVKAALEMLTGVVRVVGTSIGVLAVPGVKRDLKPIPYREVERLQDAAKTLREAAGQEVRDSSVVTRGRSPCRPGERTEHMSNHLLEMAYRQLVESARQVQADPSDFYGFLDDLSAFRDTLLAVPGAEEKLDRRAAETAGPRDSVGMGYGYLSHWPEHRGTYETNKHGGKWLADELLAEIADKIPRAAAAMVDWASRQAAGGTSVEKPAGRTRPKKSTIKGEAEAKLIGALTKHHQYADGGCLNLEPIGVRELADEAKVAPSTASVFFQNYFKGHVKYRQLCGDQPKLVAALKLLNQEFCPYHLFGRTPPGEGEHNEDDQ